MNPPFDVMTMRRTGVDICPLQTGADLERVESAIAEATARRARRPLLGTNGRPRHGRPRRGPRPADLRPPRPRRGSRHLARPALDPRLPLHTAPDSRRDHA
jgi:hypothetical protein